eukprot:g2390.t1
MERKGWSNEDIIMEGYLEKKSTEGIAHFRNWNKRYFILYPTELRYYKKMTLSSFGKTYNDLRGIIPLGVDSVGSITVTRGSNHSGHKSSLRFDVISEVHEGQKLASSDSGRMTFKSYGLRAPSSDEADRWVINIRKVHAGKFREKKKKAKKTSAHSKHHVKKFKKKRAEKVQAPPQEPSRRRRYSLVDDVLETIDDKYATAPTSLNYSAGQVSYDRNYDNDVSYGRGPLPPPPPGIRNMDKNVKPRYDPNIHDYPTRGRGFSKVGEILRNEPILDQRYSSDPGYGNIESTSVNIPHHKIQQTKLKHKPPPGIRTASMQNMNISGNTLTFASSNNHTLSSVPEGDDYEYDPGLDYSYEVRNQNKRLPPPPAGIRTASQMNVLA